MLVGLREVQVAHERHMDERRAADMERLLRQGQSVEQRSGRTHHGGRLLLGLGEQIARWGRQLRAGAASNRIFNNAH